MKVILRLSIAGLALTAGAALAQRRTPPPAPTPQEQQAVQQGMEALFKALGGAGQPGGQPAALIEHRELRALLPTAIAGFKRTATSSERSGAMGMSVSRAEATFEGAKDARLKIEFTDIGGLGGIGLMAHAAWASADVDRESDDGFERTAKYKGLKALEEYDNSSRSGKMQVLVGQRIVVSVEGDQVAFEGIRAAMDLVNLDKLAALKPAEAK